MIKATLIFTFFLSIVLFNNSCTESSGYSESAYMKWLSNPKNGIVKSKKVNGVEIKVKYLPAEYLAYREIKNGGSYSQNQKDSILNLYKSNATFLLTINPDEEKNNQDVMFKDISSYPEYAERSHVMNFNMEEYISLSAGSREYRPVLSALENIYSAGPGRNIMLVFAPAAASDQNLSKSEQMQFTYNDELFGTGTLHFVFTRNEFDQIPSLKF